MSKKPSRLKIVEGSSPEAHKTYAGKKLTQHDLAAFPDNPTYPQQQYMDSHFRDTDIILQLGSAGTGKAQPNDRLVKTPDGWLPIGEIEIGQELTMPDGSVSLVDGIFPQGEKLVYRVEFEDGRETECCSEHLWKVQHSRWKNAFKVISMGEIKEKIEKTKHMASYRPFRIPLVLPEEKNNLKKEVLIDPYVMGMYLGDGSSRGGCFKITTADADIRNILEDRIVDGYKLSVCSDNITYAFVREVNDKKINHNYYVDSLSNYGINGLRSWEKYIPVDYIDGLDKEQKLELIRGLMDSDGEVDSNGSVYYHTTSEKLRIGFIEVLRSLGGIAYTKERYTKYDYLGEKRIGRKSYRVRVRFTEPKELFNLPRKRDQVSENSQYSKCNLAIESIKDVGIKECTCISVNHPDHLYITDDYIVTHNTFTAMYCALADVFNSATPYDKIAIFRSAVQGRDIGFLPGDQAEKDQAYEAPYKALCDEAMKFKTNNYDNLKASGYIDFHNTSFLRGTTFNDTILLVDECQSMTYLELSTLITRVGIRSKIIFCGDTKQNDLHKKTDISGLEQFLKVINKMPSSSTDIVRYTPNDIVRSGICKAFLLAEEEV